MARNIFRGEAPVLENLVAQAVLVKAAASLLAEDIGCSAAAKHRLATSIRVLQANGHCLARENAALLWGESFNLLRRRYDPDYLQGLSSRLDGILDAIEEAAFCLSAHDCPWLVADIPLACRSLKGYSQVIYLTVEEIAHQEEWTIACAEICSLTEEASENLQQSVHALPGRAGEPLTIFANQVICDALKQAVLSCKGALRQLHLLQLFYG